MVVTAFFETLSNATPCKMCQNELSVLLLLCLENRKHGKYQTRSELLHVLSFSSLVQSETLHSRTAL